MHRFAMEQMAARLSGAAPLGECWHQQVGVEWPKASADQLLLQGGVAPQGGITAANHQPRPLIIF